MPKIVTKYKQPSTFSHAQKFRPDKRCSHLFIFFMVLPSPLEHQHHFNVVKFITKIMFPEKTPHAAKKWEK